MLVNLTLSLPVPRGEVFACTELVNDSESYSRAILRKEIYKSPAKPTMNQNHFQQLQIHSHLASVCFLSYQTIVSRNVRDQYRYFKHSLLSSRTSLVTRQIWSLSISSPSALPSWHLLPVPLPSILQRSMMAASAEVIVLPSAYALETAALANQGS